MNINQNVKRIRECFDAIKTSIGNEKKEVVKSISSYPIVLNTLCLYLDPMIVFHLGKKSFEKETNLHPVDYGNISFIDVAMMFAGKRSVTLQDISDLNHYLNTRFEDSDDRQFLKDFLCRTIKLGITGKTVNEAVGAEVVHEISCMLANKYFEHADTVEGKEFYLTEKLDGIRCICYAQEGETPHFYTRQGHPIEGMTEVERDIKKIIDQTNISLVFDGELLISDRDNIPSKTQYKRTTNIIRTDGEKFGITYNVFDVIGYNKFVKKTTALSYSRRRTFLDIICENNADLKAVVILPVLYHGRDTSEIMKHLAHQRELQHEGVMINIASDPYCFTRTNSLLKVKVMQDCDLKITGFQEGNGKYTGTLGALIVNYKGNPVGVGSGLSDEMRKIFWENRTEYLGRVVKVQYFEETQDANGKLSIRFPVFVELREEEKEVSYS